MQSDLGFHCSHMPEERFLHGAAQKGNVTSFTEIFLQAIGVNIIRVICTDFKAALDIYCNLFIRWFIIGRF